MNGGKGMAGGTNDEIGSAGKDAAIGYATQYAKENPDQVVNAMKNKEVRNAALNAV